MVGSTAIGQPSAIANLRRVLEDSPGGVLITVACVLDKLPLGLLEALQLALTGLDEGPLRRVPAAVMAKRVRVLT